MAHHVKIGIKVTTPLGIGTVVGKDLPESHVWRWVVTIEEPKAKWEHWQGKEAAFFPKLVYPVEVGAPAKSDACRMTLQLMDKDHDYESALQKALSEFPLQNKAALEAELTKYI